MSTGKVFVEICVAGSDLFEGEVPVNAAYDLPRIARGELTYNLPGGGQVSSNENVYKCKVCGEWHNEKFECVEEEPHDPNWEVSNPFPPKWRALMFDVMMERHRQESKWGEQNHHATYWIAVLGEEYGEVCKSILEGRITEAKLELTQVAAVCLAIIECAERNNWKDTGDTQSD